MSKITNDGLTRSGTGCFIAVPYDTIRQNSLTWTRKLSIQLNLAHVVWQQWALKG